MVDLVAFAKGAQLGADTVYNIKQKRNAIKDDRKKRDANKQLDALALTMNEPPRLVNNQGIEQDGHIDINTFDVNGPSFADFQSIAQGTLSGNASFEDRMKVRGQAIELQRQYALKGISNSQEMLRQSKNEKDPEKRKNMQRLAEMRLAQVFKAIPNGQSAHFEALPEGDLIMMLASEGNPEHKTGSMVLDEQVLEEMLTNFSGREGAKNWGDWTLQMEKEHQNIEKQDQAMKWYEPLKTIDAYNAATTNYLKTLDLEQKENAAAAKVVQGLQYGAYANKTEYNSAMNAVDKFGTNLMAARTKRQSAEYKAQSDPYAAGFPGEQAPEGAIAEGEAVPIVSARLDSLLDSPYFADATMTAKEMVKYDASVTPSAAFERAAILAEADAKGREEGSRDKYISSIDDPSSPTGKRLVVYGEEVDAEGKRVPVKSFNAPPSWTGQAQQKKVLNAKTGGPGSLAKKGLKLVGVDLPNGHTIQVPVPKGMSAAQIQKSVKQEQQGGQPAPQQGAIEEPAPVSEPAQASEGAGIEEPAAAAPAAVPAENPATASEAPVEAVADKYPEVDRAELEKISSLPPEQKMKARDTLVHEADEAAKQGTMDPAMAKTYAAYLELLGDEGLQGVQIKARDQAMALLESIASGEVANSQLSGQRTLAPS